MSPTDLGGPGGSQKKLLEKGNGARPLSTLEYRNFLVECAKTDMELSFMPKNVYMLILDFGLKFTLWHLPKIKREFLK